MTTDRDDRLQPFVSLAHEALLSRWPRLKEIVDQDREFLRARTRAAVAALRWRRESRNVDFLLPEGKPLAEARDLVKSRRGDLDAEIVEFIEQSIRHRTRQRRRRARWIASITGVVLTVVSAFAGVSFFEWRDARRQKNQADVNYSRAMANLQRAIASVDTLVSRVGEKQLETVPRMEKVRQALLKDALKANSELLLEAGDDPRMRLVVAQSQRRLGDIQRLLEQSPEAELAFKRAIGTLDGLHKLSPRDRTIGYELARCHTGLGIIRAGSNQFADAETEFRQALELYQKLADEAPDRLEAQQEVLTVRSNLASLKRQADREAEAESEWPRSGPCKSSSWRAFHGRCTPRRSWRGFVRPGDSRRERPSGRRRQRLPAPRRSCRRNWRGKRRRAADTGLLWPRLTARSGCSFWTIAATRRPPMRSPRPGRPSSRSSTNSRVFRPIARICSGAR